MSLRLKPYSEYKNSGLPWAGEVPSHWELLKTKYLFQERVEKGFPNEPLLAATQTKGVVPKEQYENRTVLALKDLHLLKLVERGDYVISLRSFQGGIEYAHYRGIISPAYTVLVPGARARREFFEFFFKSPHFVSSLSLFVTGIRQGQNIDYERLGRVLLPVPTIEEQVAIGGFLRSATARFARFIRGKRRLIELLNEQKQAIIQKAVTRGLDPNVRLKPSGIEWLGDIPEHWEVRRLKQLAKILRGKFSHRPRNDPDMYDGPYPFIQTGDVSRAAKFITAYDQTLNGRGLSVSKMFPSGTLVMTIAANIGDVAMLTFDACFPDSVVGFVPSKSLDSNYLYYALLCMKAELMREAPVNTQGNLNVERIGAVLLPLPPSDEQKRIAIAVERDTLGLSVMIDRAKREIDLIREYRTRLIADVVTGKLDVRGVELPPLGEAEEPPALGDEVLNEATEEEIELEPVEEGADAAD
jgi:type I restriction enzyme S subunit